MSTLFPVDIVLHKVSQVLEIAFDNGERFELPAEYLRTHSPSAEVQGHGSGQQVLVYGRKYIKIMAVEPVGNYALQLRFDDGHASGIYSWQLLAELGRNHERNWQAYLGALEQTGRSREPGVRRKQDG